MSAGELESGNAGEPAKLIRQRYREASDIIKKGKMSSLFINDLDAGAGRMGDATQYTVNNQMVSTRASCSQPRASCSQTRASCCQTRANGSEHLHLGRSSSRGEGGRGIGLFPFCGPTV